MAAHARSPLSPQELPHDSQDSYGEAPRRPRVPYRSGGVVPASSRIPAGEARLARPQAWSLAELAGRLVELSSPGAGATLTLAVALVLDAQRRRETVAWVTSRESCFFPPDVAASGVDLDALAVIRLPDPAGVARAAERLVRSGAFGLVVLDLGEGDVAMPMQARLVGLAERHDAAVLCLTRKPARAPSLSSLVSLRAEARRRRVEEGVFACSLETLKDKRRPPGWTLEEVRHAPPGLR